MTFVAIGALRVRSASEYFYHGSKHYQSFEHPKQEDSKKIKNLGSKFVRVVCHEG